MLDHGGHARELARRQVDAVAPHRQRALAQHFVGQRGPAADKERGRPIDRPAIGHRRVGVTAAVKPQRALRGGQRRLAGAEHMQRHRQPRARGAEDERAAGGFAAGLLGGLRPVRV